MAPAICWFFAALTVCLATISSSNAQWDSFIGALVGFLPLAWFAAVIGPGQLVHALFIFPVFELSSSAYLPLSSAPIELRWIFYLSIFAGVINLIASFMALRHGRPEGGRL